MKATGTKQALELPWVRAKNRRRSKWVYDKLWVRNRRGGPWPDPDGTTHHQVPSPDGDIRVHVLAGDGTGVIVLSHPDRRYAGHWFVKEGYVTTLHDAGYTVIWYDNPRYGQGEGGSPYLAENVLNVAAFARDLDAGPVHVIGVSLGSFAAAIAAPHMPWVQRLVLESLYPDFMSWYEGKGRSMERLALGTWRVLFRGDYDELQTPKTLAATEAKILAVASEEDTVTPAALSRRAVEGTHATWYTATGEHLHLWQDAAYRQAVLDFLA
ncbi:MAG: alpha/beta hydrolase family protein [Thermoplasmatota archaeon]